MITVSEYHSFLVKHVMRPFQKEILDAAMTHNKVAVLGSRQLGKTWIVSYIAIMLGLGTKDSPGHATLVISENQAKARKIIEDIHAHLDKMEKVCGPLRKANRGGLFEVVLINGVSITAKPGKPSALQGFSGSVLVDEMSLSNFDVEELFGQALIVSSAKPYFKAIFLTNADKTGTFVHSLFRNDSNEWNERRKDMALLEYNVYDVYEELPDKIVQIKNTIHQKLWRCFYLNEFVSSNISFLDHDLIEEAKTVEITHRDPITVLSYDPGFSKDGSGIVIAEVSDKISVIEEHLIFGMEIQEQLEFIHTLLERHQIGSIVFDQGVGGIVVGQQLKRRYGALVKPQSINRNFYQKTSAELERLFYEGKIQIPAKCENLIQDLKSFEKTSRGLFSAEGCLVSHIGLPQMGAHTAIVVLLS
jgi:phage FluMu gp28-like protein